MYCTCLAIRVYYVYSESEISPQLFTQRTPSCSHEPPFMFREGKRPRKCNKPKPTYQNSYLVTDFCISFKNPVYYDLNRGPTPAFTTILAKSVSGTRLFFSFFLACKLQLTKTIWTYKMNSLLPPPPSCLSPLTLTVACLRPLKWEMKKAPRKAPQTTACGNCALWFHQEAC